jgi:hypothetical protein
MAALSSSQKAIVKRIVEIGKQVGASPKEIKAALETGRVESNFTNSPTMTDHDSQGWRQERASLYKDPTNLDASIRRFFSETKAVKHKYARAGELAAAVQRPAAQYRGRYQGVSSEADALMRQFGVMARGGKSSAPSLTASAAGTTSSPGSRAPSTSTVTTVIPGTPASDNRKEVLAQYLLNKHDPSALLNAALAVKVDPGTPEQRVTKTIPVPGSTGTPKSTSGGPAKLPKGTPANPATGAGGAAAAVKWAQSTVGVAETGGANRGPRIDQWQQRFKTQGQFWCAMWTSLAATKGGMPRSGRTPLVVDVYNAAAKGGNPAYQKGFIDPRKAKPGDLIVFGRDQHIGMVEKNTGSGLVMIAGNDANKVNRRTVAYGNGDIVRPKYRS